MKQTAVDWFASKLMYLKMNPKEVFEFVGWLEEAKEMEKEQIEDAYDSGQVLGLYLGSINEDETDQTGEIFYQEKYK
jgi:cell division inhibitor SulA